MGYYCYRLLWDIIVIGSYGTLIYGIYVLSVLKFFSSAEIVGSNPVGGVDTCLLRVLFICQVEVFARS
jgi:hypothetical protein